MDPKKTSNKTANISGRKHYSNVHARAYLNATIFWYQKRQSRRRISAVVVVRIPAYIVLMTMTDMLFTFFIKIK